MLAKIELVAFIEVEYIFAQRTKDMQNIFNEMKKKDDNDNIPQKNTAFNFK